MRSLGILLMLFSLSFLVAGLAGFLGMADGKGTEYFDSLGFFIRVYLSSALITFAFGFTFWFVGGKKSPGDFELLDREGFAVVGLAWLLVASFGAIPYMMAGELEPLDAYFEGMSGFTTTGATMLETHEVTNETWNGSYEFEEFRDMIFHNITFDNASFRKVDFYGVYFNNCTFINTSFTKTDFHDSMFITCRFVDSRYNNETILLEERSPQGFFKDAEFRDTPSDDWKKVYYPWPKSLLFWRSLTQWLGGMGIVVLTIVILSRFIGSSMQLLKVDLPGLTMTRLKPSIVQTAAIFWKIYALFTFVAIALLRMSGMPLFDAFSNSFTCLSSGGFSPRAMNIEAYDNALYEAIFVVFMVVAGTNFVLHFHLLHGDWRKLVNNSEFRTLISIMLLTTLVITIKLSLDSFYSPLSSLRYAVFQVVSLNTATGYSSIGYGDWPESTRFLLVILMVIGGSAGSTSGGLKVIRLMVLMKLARREISKAIHPQREMPITIGGRTLPDNLVQAVGTYFFVYLGILVIASAVVMFTGEGLMDSVSTVATTMGGVGPPAGAEGPYFSFSAMHPLAKVVLISCMWLGRIEILAGFILFAPWSYRE